MKVRRKAVSTGFYMTCIVSILWACSGQESEETPLQNTSLPLDSPSEAAKEQLTDTAVPSASTSDSEAEPAPETETADHELPDAPQMEEWQKAYLEYIEEPGPEYSDTFTYALIYVDEDDIPEFLIDTGISAGGCLVLTCHDGHVDEQQILRCNFSYMEKGNLLCNWGGHMGSYYDYVYTIQDGKWVSVAKGEYGDGPNGIRFDEDGNEIYVYQWNGEDVSEEEYNRQLNAVFPQEQACDPIEKSRYYIAREMRSLLQTGAVTSAGHRYELIVQDMSWEEARRSCEEKGGYLAVITSLDERERIEQQIVSEGKTDISFWVEANNGRIPEDSWGFRWMEPEAKTYYNLLDLSNALWWWDDQDTHEPSYTTLTKDGEKIKEDCVMLFYRQSDNRCCLTDKPEDILSVFPSYAGRIGYICEYNDSLQ